MLMVMEQVPVGQIRQYCHHKRHADEHLSSLPVRPRFPSLIFDKRSLTIDNYFYFSCYAYTPPQLLQQSPTNLVASRKVETFASSAGILARLFMARVRSRGRVAAVGGLI
jgi:hypothetical protein